MNRATFIKWLTFGTGSAVTTASTILSTPPTLGGVELLTCVVAGHQYYMAHVPTTMLTSGRVLRLRREPSNPHDSNAIAVYVSSFKIGYIPRDQNTILSAMLDQDLLLHAVLSKYDPTYDPWDRILITIHQLR